jgi:hypothetical protein
MLGLKAVPVGNKYFQSPMHRSEFEYTKDNKDRKPRSLD